MLRIAIVLFLVPAAAAAEGLSVSGVVAARGEPGETVILSGHGFDARTRVSFGPLEAARVATLSTDRIVVVVPPGDGLVDVCVSNGDEMAVAHAAYRFGVGSVLDEGEPQYVGTCWEGGDPLVDAPAALALDEGGLEEDGEAAAVAAR